MINALILLSILFSSSAQLFLKKGADNLNIPETLNGSNVIAVVFELASNWFLLLGVSCHVVALLIWIYVLKHVEVSYAYPFIALGFVFVLASGYFFFDESLSATKVAGTVLIAIGTIVIARG